jgi:hypothetical protein
MIPKKVHYVWLGEKKKPIEIVKNIENWKKILNDYEFIEWNERNYDLTNNSCKYLKEAYKKREWSFVSDYIRLDVLFNYGGIYLDTDVKLLKKFDKLLDLKGFLCKESNKTLCTAVIGSEKKSEWLKIFLNLYNKRSFIDNNKIDRTPNSRYLYDNLNSVHYIFCEGPIINDKVNLQIFPSSYFSPKNFFSGKVTIETSTIAIHMYEGSWKSTSGKIKLTLIRIIVLMFGEHFFDFLQKVKNELKRMFTYGG